jgi:hypothetical protein
MGRRRPEREFRESPLFWRFFDYESELTAIDQERPIPWAS